MATPGTPQDPNTLGELREEIDLELDGEVNTDLIDRWINREVERLSTKREFGHFLKVDKTLTLGVQDADGISILELPTDLKKVFSILTKDATITADGTGVTTQLFRRGYHYEMFWNATRKAWDAHFDSVGNDGVITMQATYFQLAGRMLQDSDITLIAKYYSNVILTGVLMKGYRKLGDLTEYQIVKQEHKELIDEMIDDDARDHDSPEQMGPSRQQGGDEYAAYLANQQYVRDTFWQRYN